MVSLAASICLAAPGAWGEDPVVPKTLVVLYSDLDLSRSRDAAVLYARIVRAASKVCTQNKIRAMELQRCIDIAVARAVAEVDAPLVNAEFEARHP